MGKSFADQVTELRRLRLLEALENSAGYRASSPLLQRFLVNTGVGCSLKETEAQLAWLAEHGMVLIESPDDLMIVKIKQRGLDVGRGLEDAEGVARPEP